ncbi:MAG: site-2 protease family protein [Cardiobacteriaceae bacterium]|nr:site-2 protease family protein [Cardiobacteriaceae bacterium]
MSFLIVFLIFALMSVGGWLYEILAVPLARAVRLQSAPGKLPHPLLEPMFEASHEALQALGFRLDAVLQIAVEPPMPGSDLLRLYRSADGLTIAEVLTYLTAESGDACQVLFVSRDAADHLVVTAPWQEAAPLYARLADVQSSGKAQAWPDIATQYAAHREMAAAQSVPWGDAEAVRERLQRHENLYWDGMQTHGFTAPHPDGGRRFTLRAALRLLPHLLRRPAQALANADDIPPARLALIYELWRTNRARGAPQAHVQWGFFLLSAALFLALTAWIAGKTFALALFIVIALHEGGHWLAMRALGYRRVRILFLPLAGGVTIGEEQHPSARDRAWVALAGPLPGIVIGAALLAFAPPVPFCWMLGGLLVFINLFNLLPVLPLDGGQMLQSLVGHKAVWLSQGFCALSIAAILAFAWWSGLWWTAVLALAPYSSLKTLAQQGQWLRAWQSEAPPETALDADMRAFAIVADPRYPKAVTRLAHADQLLRQVHFVPLAGKDAARIAVLWLAAFAVLAMPAVREIVRVFARW